MKYIKLTNAEENHPVNIHNAVIDGESADHGENNNDRHQDVLRYFYDFRKQAYSRKSENQQKYVPDKHGADDKPEYICRTGHQQGPRLQTMNIHGADHDSRYGIPGNPQCQHRDAGASDTGVIGRFAGNQPFHGALSEGNLRYMREWTQVLSDDPSVIRQVTRDSRRAVELICTQIGVRQPQSLDICSTFGVDLLQAKYGSKEHAPRKRTVYDSVNERTGKPRLGRRRGAAHL